MKYRLLAKAFLFVKGSQNDVTREDAIWLTEGEKKKFTEKQLDKLNTIVADLIEKAQDKLESQGIDFGAMLKHMPAAGAVGNDRSASEQAAEASDENEED